MSDWIFWRNLLWIVGRVAGRFAIRTGDYRVQFRVEVDTIIVERVGHRDRFYEE